LPDRSNRTTWSWFLGCCFLVIVGFRWFLIERYGAPVGWGDDIDGIAEKILAPWQAGTLQWQALFAPHNGDHVILATRLWEILWFELNGEWDPKLVMIAKAPVYAVAMTIFMHLLTRGLERGRFVAAGMLTVLFAFPFNYHNLLWAFQSQFDFFLLTAALGWLALLNGRPALALAMAAISPLTLGAGPVLAVSYVGYWISRKMFNRGVDEHSRALGAVKWRRVIGYCFAAVVVAALGASLPTPDAMPRAGGVGDKLATLLKLYAWPFSNLLSVVERLPEASNLIPGRLLNFPSAESSWMLGLAGAMHRHPGIVVLINLPIALVLVAPWVAVAILVARGRMPVRPALGALALSGFVALMLAATAVARSDQPTIAIRFVDHVMLAGFISIVSGFVLVARHRRCAPWFALWLLVLGTGYLATAGATLSQMVNRRKPQLSLELMQQYYAGDRTPILQKENLRLFIMSDDPSDFFAELDDPAVKAVMPRVVLAPEMSRAPVALKASALASWGLAMAGFAAVAAAYLALRRRKSPRFAGTPVVTPA
jgi:hypothetical protein